MSNLLQTKLLVTIALLLGSIAGTLAYQAHRATALESRRKAEEAIQQQQVKEALRVGFQSWDAKKSVHTLQTYVPK